MTTLKATITTNKGPINLHLFPDKTPLTVANFVHLANRKFYNGLVFHRVINDFMIQAGCPFGTGSGGPGYQFADEFNPTLRHDKPGVLSMANAGPKTNGSQFFITHVPTPWLDNKHSIFGEVVSGDDQAIVNMIEQNDRIISINITGDTAILETMADTIAEWNRVLDAREL